MQQFMYICCMADGTANRILDAALAVLAESGIRGLSMETVARRAQVNRVTIYRRFTNRDELLRALITREIDRLLAEVTAIGATTQGTDSQIEKMITYVLLETRRHPLARRLVTPERVLLVGADEAVQQGISYIASVLEFAQQRGVIDDYDVQPVAEVLARFAHSLLLTPGSELAGSSLEEMAEFVRVAFVPVVRHGIAAAARPLVHPTVD